MRYAILFSVALLVPASLPAQTQATCSDFLNLPEGVRAHYASAMLAGYTVAVGRAKAYAASVDSGDLDNRDIIYGFLKRTHPDADRDSLRRIVAAEHRGHREGTQLLADFLERQVTGLDSSVTTQEIALRMAAECSRSENANGSFALVFWRVLQDLQQDSDGGS